MIRASSTGATQSATNPIKTEPSLTAPLDGVKEKSNIITEPTRTTVVDLERVPKSQLLVNVKGSPWAVTFYRRLMGKNDSKTLFDPSVANPTQQLERINNLELRVLSAIDPQQDTSTKVYTREGESYVPVGVAVNEFDVFTAPIGQNRIGFFSVNVSERKTDNKQSVYHITYSMLYELTERVQSVLDACTVRTYHYVVERAWSGLDTLLTAEEYGEFIDISRWKQEIERTYVKRYYDNIIHSLRVPSFNTTRHNDVFLTQFVRGLGLRHEAYDLNVYPHLPLQVGDVETLWTALRNRSKYTLPETNRPFNWYSKKCFRTSHVRNSVGFSNVDATLFFSDDFRTGQPRITEADPHTVPFELKPSSEQLPDGTPLPLYQPMTKDSYVLSRAFYEGSYTSLLEKCLQMFLNEQRLPTSAAVTLAAEASKLPPLERCYYTPLVYLLLCYAR